MLVFSSAVLGASYTGRLIDARCARQQPNSTCNPAPTTTQFALISAGKLLTFDSMGNTRASEALKQRTNRTNEEQLPNAARGVNAMVQGEVTGYRITVREIEVQ
jgi:hypothetical protein